LCGVASVDHACGCAPSQTLIAPAAVCRPLYFVKS
jgi:hypothetical protein